MSHLNGIETELVDSLRKMLQDQAAIMLPPGKEYLIQTRLAPLAKDLGLPDLRTLLKKLAHDPFGAIHQDVIDRMTTNETSFFRENQHFQALTDVVLPDIFERNARSGRVNIWCGACSAGQEPYTIAMILREHFAKELARFETKIIASDISPTMLDYAKKGLYRRIEVRRGLSDEMRDKYFTEVGDNFQAIPELRKLIDFRPINLTRPWVLPKIDLVFLRNVLIYFDMDTRRGILDRVATTLGPGGYLFVGSSESIFEAKDNYDLVMLGSAICHRVKEDSSKQPDGIPDARERRSHQLRTLTNEIGKPHVERKERAKTDRRSTVNQTGGTSIASGRRATDTAKKPDAIDANKQLQERYVDICFRAVQKVFSTMLSIPTIRLTTATKPVKDGSECISAIIGLSGDVEGSMALNLTSKTAEKIATSFLGIDIEWGSEDMTDAVGEIANMIVGNAKAGFTGRNVTITTPTVVLGQIGRRIQVSRNAAAHEIPCSCTQGLFTLDVVFTKV